MQRRDLLRMIAAATGTAFIGAKGAFAYTREIKLGENIFSAEEIAFLDEVAEVIIPATDTPGAKDAEVGKFMAVFVSDCYDNGQQESFRAGVELLKTYAQDAYDKPFLELDDSQRLALIEDIASLARNQAAAAEEDEEPEPHWFTPIHQLVLFGFFTSEKGATEVLRYEPVPGEYIGDLDYKGEPAWAT